jgi:hypothetical protein
LDELATSYHEAGHGAVAVALGSQLRVVTVEPGEQWAGCTRYLASLVAAPVPEVTSPLVTWGGQWMERLAGDACVTMGGDLAEDLWARRCDSRLPEPVAETALRKLEQRAAREPELATPAERGEAAEAVNDPQTHSDADHLDRLGGETASADGSGRLNGQR